jgi:hypothetical protein
LTGAPTDTADVTFARSSRANLTGVARLGLIVTVTAGALATLAGNGLAAGLRPGCDATRPAVAYRPGGAPLRPQPARAPIPCLEVINQRSSESADVDVLRSGRILYAPLVENSYQAPLDDKGPAEIAASDNGGASWRTIMPGDANHVLEVPPWMSVDPKTQRIWFASVLPDLCGAEISWSDDGGRTWQTNPAVGCPAMGSESVLEGPAPTAGAKPSGYPHVVYYCANASDLSPSNLWCYRSLDGGTGFSFTGSFPDPPPQPGCNTEHAARPGAVGADGYLYFPVFQCGELSMAISRDEGASWRLVHIGSENVQDMYTTSVAVDPAGNLYLAWIEGVPGGTPQPAGGGPNPATEAIDGTGVPELSVSHDHGVHWSAPVNVGPRGIKNAQTVAIAVHGVGQVAISYLANPNGGKLVDGWLSESSDALARHALWWAAPVNDPRTPLIDAGNSTSFGNRLFFDTASFAPSGQPWAAFHCAFTAACPNERIGVVGHLAPGRAPGHHHKHKRARHR